MAKVVKMEERFEAAPQVEKVAFRDQPVVVGLGVMFRGVFAFFWFVLAAIIAWLISSQTGWFAAMYFVLLVFFFNFGVKCLNFIGQKTIDDRKKG